MRYLTLSADYMEARIRDEATGSADVAGVGLSAKLTEEIVQWNHEYQYVIPLDLDERRSRSPEIDRLDEHGRALARRVADELAPAKVRYYSEGWLRYLT